MAVLTTSTAIHAADGALSLSTGLDYSVGAYGDTQDTETWFLPLNLKYRSGRYTFKLGTSHLWVKGPQSVTPEGDPLSGGGTKRMVHGAGDVTTSLLANVLDEDKAWLDLDLTGKIKFGTADTRKALGTGENDTQQQALNLILKGKICLQIRSKQASLLPKLHPSSSRVLQPTKLRRQLLVQHWLKRR